MPLYQKVRTSFVPLRYLIVDRDNGDVIARNLSRKSADEKLYYLREAYKYQYIKLQKLNKVSNPETVAQRAREHGILSLKPSTKPDKKYMFTHPITREEVHFGDIEYEDWTKHLDPVRRRNFKRRNEHWSKAEKFSPAWASYFLTW